MFFRVRHLQVCLLILPVDASKPPFSHQQMWPVLRISLCCCEDDIKMLHRTRLAQSLAHVKNTINYTYSQDNRKIRIDMVKIINPLFVLWKSQARILMTHGGASPLTSDLKPICQSIMIEFCRTVAKRYICICVHVYIHKHVYTHLCIHKIYTHTSVYTRHIYTYFCICKTYIHTYVI